MWARNVREFCLNADFHVTFRDLLHAVKLRHGTDGFISPPKEGVLRIFLCLVVSTRTECLNTRRLCAFPIQCVHVFVMNVQLTSITFLHRIHLFFLLKEAQSVLSEEHVTYIDFKVGRLVVGLSSRRCRFDPGRVNVRYLVEKVALGKCSLQQFFVPYRHYSIIFLTETKGQ